MQFRIFSVKYANALLECSKILAQKHFKVELLSFYKNKHIRGIIECRDQPWFSVFKHSMDHEEGV